MATSLNLRVSNAHLRLVCLFSAQKEAEDKIANLVSTYIALLCGVPLSNVILAKVRYLPRLVSSNVSFLLPPPKLSTREGEGKGFSLGLQHIERGGLTLPSQLCSQQKTPHVAVSSGREKAHLCQCEFPSPPVLTAAQGHIFTTGEENLLLSHVVVQ